MAQHQRQMKWTQNVQKSSKKIAILGGGVSGISLALFIKEHDPEYQVTVFDCAKSVASRILVSGNGRCNFFNSFYLSEKESDDENLKKIKPILEGGYGRKAFDDFVRMLDFPYYENGGLYYPFANKSSAIYESMKDRLNEYGIQVKSERVVSIDEASDESISFKTMDENSKVKSYEYPFIALAMGGNSLNYQPFDWKILDCLNIKHIPYTPCLCPLKVKENGFKPLDGVRAKCVMTLQKVGRNIYQEEGEVLFKKDGLSGICIFNASSYIDPSNIDLYSISLNLLSHSSMNIDVNEKNIEYSLIKELATYVKERAKASNKSLNETARNLLFRISDFYPFKSSQISRGGIETSQIDFADMSLKNHRNVIVLGEMIDLTLPCGGYNIGLCIIEAYKAMLGLLGERS